MTQMSGSRSINVKAEYPVRVKTVVGHSSVGVCGCVCSVAPLLITIYASRYSKWLRTPQTSLLSLLRGCKISHEWQRGFQKLIFSSSRSHSSAKTLIPSNWLDSLRKMTDVRPHSSTDCAAWNEEVTEFSSPWSIWNMRGLSASSGLCDAFSLLVALQSIARFGSFSVFIHLAARIDRALQKYKNRCSVS